MSLLLLLFMLIAAVRGFSIGSKRVFRPYSMTPILTEAATTDTMKKAKIVTDLEGCGARLRQGELVAFPTETVYGLGCYALDVDAVHKVFAAKERPLTDPLIVHVLEPADAFALWEAKDETETAILSKLCRDFWPGPLTLVAKADSERVPEAIMANTGYCACRSPSHATARALLKTSQRPLAAPSANKFGHVSPTTAEHVFDDLQNEDVWILDEEDHARTGCHVGVESTVAKLEMNEGRGLLTVLRQGAVSVQDIELSLTGLPVVVKANLKRVTKETEANVAPGQSIRHYSPNIPSYLLSPKCIQDKDSEILQDAVIIDYGGQLSHWKDSARAYRDLAPKGDSAEAAQAIFETLRWAELIQKARWILFPDLQPEESDALALAVKDRLTRAASGIVIDSLVQASREQSS